MAQKKVVDTSEISAEAGVLRIYEIGYHIVPSTKEEDVEKVVSSLRAAIEKAQGSFIAEGAPSMTKLSYPVTGIEAGKSTEFDRAYFGWLKFEAPSEAASKLEEMLKADKNIMRHILFQTVREDTRAKVKMGGLREVRRTDVIKTTPKREEDTSIPVSEVDLDKALSDITAE